jgi:outer membrane protein assembly factor BamB
MKLSIGVRAWQSNPWFPSGVPLKRPVAAVLISALAVLTAADAAPAEENWSRFRGPNGTGISTLKGVPVQWTEEDYAWVIELPGTGHSSPVFWGDSLFVASGGEAGKRMVICLDARTGDSRWMQTLTLLPEPEGGLHVKNSYGSGSPTTDGERVYVSFADDDHYQLSAFDFHTGDPVWTVDLGPFVSQHGHGQSPMLWNDLVIATNDQIGPSFIAAFNRKTGEEVWRTPRAARETSYATPFILDPDGRRPQLICLNGMTGMTSLDPQSGQTLWGTGEMPKRTVASPILAGDVLIASCGQRGRGTYMMAVDPPAHPDSEPRIRWERSTLLPYVPTPLVQDGILYLWTDDGVVCSVDPHSGTNLNRLRVGGTYSSSPVLIDGRIYCPAEDGEIAVVALTPELKLLGKSPLGDRTHATPGVGPRGVYFRGFHTLACLPAQSVE